MNRKLLEQLALAKEAGTKAMAKDFFAPAPGSTPPEGQSQSEGDAAAQGDGSQGGDANAATGGISPEQLEELMRMLEAQGGAQGGGGQ